jgi:hypothetical protein
MEKNLHLSHIEDSPYIGGVDMTRAAVNFLISIAKMLEGTTPNKPVTLTTKWDGAPAIIAGINPENGKFFVGTKGVFAQAAKLNYTPADIDKNHPGPGLNEKLKWALRYLKELGFKPNRILQGDMMYIAPDLSVEDIAGEKSVTFRPNTIKYAVPLDSKMGQKIKDSKIGIVFHTEYKGDTIASLKASYKPHIGGLNQSKDVWFRDAEFTDASGAATFTKSESEAIAKELTLLGQAFKRTSGYVLNRLAANKDLNVPFQTFNNSKIRAGEVINPSRHIGEFITWLEDKLNKEISLLKRPESRANKEKAKKLIMSFFKENKGELRNILELHMQLERIKTAIIIKLNKANDIGTFLETPTGLEVTAPEGFVGINHEGEAIKLVDRLTFSRANFNAAKGWSK